MRRLIRALALCALGSASFAVTAHADAGAAVQGRAPAGLRDWKPSVTLAPAVTWLSGDLGDAIPSAQLGYELGAFLSHPVGGGYELRAGLGIALRGAEVEDSVSIGYLSLLGDTLSSTIHTNFNVNFVHLELPLLARGPLPALGHTGFRWSAGLTPSLRLTQSPEFLFHGPAPRDAQRFELSGVGGLGLDFAVKDAVWSFEFRYKAGLTRVFDDIAGTNRAVLFVWTVRAK